MREILSGIEQRVRGRAEQRRQQLLAATADRVRAEVRGVDVSSEGNRLILSGGGLHGRWLREPALRFLARIGR